jgi:cell division protein FtsW (lipid II flippase)
MLVAGMFFSMSFCNKEEDMGFFTFLTFIFIFYLLWNARNFIGFCLVFCFFAGMLLFMASLFLAPLSLSLESSRPSPKHFQWRRGLSKTKSLPEDELSLKIKELRRKLKGQGDSLEKSLWLNHLNRLEKLQMEKEIEREALAKLQQDSRTLRAREKSRRRLREARIKIAHETKRLEKLEKDIERSRRFLDKVNQTNETLEKRR